MISDYDDDEHFCIKCHITISGLDNYINHRKANCTKTIADIPKSPSASSAALPSSPIQLLSQDESFGLKADDFFSSLELQSSNKKQQQPSSVAPSTSGKTFSGILTRSKTSAVIHSSASEVQQSKSGKNAWIGGHQLKELGSGDNQTKLIKAVDNLSRSSACLKKEEPLAASSMVAGYNDNSEEDSDEYDYDDDDDEEEEVPRHHTGGKWMPDWGYPSAPPVHHTGGKWKPAKAPPQHHHHTKGSSVPPPTYTRGKWKPSANPPSKESSDHQQQEAFPPPGHTNGKWKPNAHDEPKMKPNRLLEDNPLFRKSNGSIQYWCNPCNRLLASKIVYERHLKSELHLKRTLHEAEFDDTDAAAATAATSTTHLNTNHDKETKRTIRKPVEYWSHTITTSSENNKDTMKNTIADVVTAGSETAVTTTTTTAATTTTKKQQRVRKRIYTKCQVCLARVSVHMMGKHLISHYHCRKGDISRPEAQQMVLDNIHMIVLQSPYQCAACNFYCNTQQSFLLHWNTRDHADTIKRNGGIVTCTFCKFSSPASHNDTMHEHLVSQEHDEVISVINRSVPIVIKNLTPIECATCSEAFVLNIQLRQHCQIANHEYSNTATDEYQKKQFCQMCDKTFNSAIALQRHLKSHNTQMFFCSHCNVKFNTSDEIVAHRKSKVHKQTTSKVVKKCEYCQECFPNVDRFRLHLQNEHPERSYSCPHCGKKFTFAQELTVHIRSKACSISSKDDENKPHKCDRCMFACDTLSELLFHQALHDEPLRLDNSKQGHYKCSLCDKYFPKSSLRYHIQNHTNEKSYQCSRCDAKFARKNNWLYHVKKHENREQFRSSSSARRSVAGGSAEKNFLCATCGAKFSNNSTLKKHMLVHSGKQFKCAHPGCIHKARTPADLRIHQGTHSTEMSFRCDRCDYRGKSKQQLKRHATVHEYVKKYQCSQCSFTCRLAFHLRRHERVHSGSKPFACPHCEYRCNNLENLRKHVLSTNKHPGKCIYECKFCVDGAPQFASNFAKELKGHLTAEHGDVFASVTEAAGYIAGIYDAADDGVNAPTSSPAPLSSHKTNPSAMLAAVDNEHNMYVIGKDEVVYVDKEAWCMVGNFDVEESGALVSFHDEDDADAQTEPLFLDHFQ